MIPPLTFGRNAMLRLLVALWISLLVPTLAAQEPDDREDPAQSPTGGVYDKPFMFRVGRTTIGGYMDHEFEWQTQEDTLKSRNFDQHRFNRFTYSLIGTRISVVLEVEFKHGVRFGDESEGECQNE